MEKQLAKRDNHALDVRSDIAQEIMLRDKGDESYRFQLRKLSTIHLGVRLKSQAGKEYPKATEYFVLPDSLREDRSFRAKLEEIGQDPDKPTKLPVMLLSNDFATSMVTSCDLYGQSGKLKCRSVDGKHCTRLNEQTFEYEDKECPAEPCKDCAWYHRFRFLLPDAAGIGYYQVVTKSDNNHGALLREIRDLRNLKRGGIAGIDLKLILTNEREFHVAVTDRQGKRSMMTTSPYLLHLEGYTNLRDILNAEQIGEVYDAEIIETDTEEDAAPVVEESEDFQAGEPEPENAQVTEAVVVNSETGEIIDAPGAVTVESIIPKATDDQRTEIVSLKTKYEIDNVILIQLIMETTGSALTVPKLNVLQAKKLIERIKSLYPKVAVKATAVTEAVDPVENE